METNDKTPCIKVCKLDNNNVCIGCKRTIEEIREAYYEKIPGKQQ